MSKVILKHIIEQLIEVQEHRIWIGSNFNKIFDGISSETAFLRPLPDLHGVAEILSHLTIWRTETILKINTGNGSITDEAEENWLKNDQLKLIGWDTILLNYKNSLTEIISLLETKEDSFLTETYYDTDFKGVYEYQFVIKGMIHHDLYHLGQLGLIIKYLNKLPNDNL